MCRHRLLHGILLLLAACAAPGLDQQNWPAARERWLASAQTPGQRRAPPDPIFSYTEMIAPVETRIGPQNRRFQLDSAAPRSERRKEMSFPPEFPVPVVRSFTQNRALRRTAPAAEEVS